MTETTSHVILELTGPLTGQDARIAGFDFINGELHVSAADAGRVEALLTAADAWFQRKGKKRSRRKRS
ncbi:MAG: hypothetical protein V7638_3826 [Acidobacteriota bacterium]|jgi:hypothetical protein